MCINKLEHETIFNSMKWLNIYTNFLHKASRFKWLMKSNITMFRSTFHVWRKIGQKHEECGLFLLCIIIYFEQCTWCILTLTSPRAVVDRIVLGILGYTLSAHNAGCCLHSIDIENSAKKDKIVDFNSFHAWFTCVWKGGILACGPEASIWYWWSGIRCGLASICP